MKRTKEETRILTVFIFMACVAVCILINYIRVSLKKYEYYKDGQFGISNQCYLTDKGDPMCLIDNQFIWVESYYEK